MRVPVVCRVGWGGGGSGVGCPDTGQGDDVSPHARAREAQGAPERREQRAVQVRPPCASTRSTTLWCCARALHWYTWGVRLVPLRLLSGLKRPLPAPLPPTAEGAAGGAAASAVVPCGHGAPPRRPPWAASRGRRAAPSESPCESPCHCLVVSVEPAIKGQNAQESIPERWSDANVQGTESVECPER